jgi:hypothetical protein
MLTFFAGTQAHQEAYKNAEDGNDTIIHGCQYTKSVKQQQVKKGPTFAVFYKTEIS